MADIGSHLDDHTHGAAPALPRILTITTADLLDALRRGWEDFKAQPSHLAFIALIYPVAPGLAGRRQSHVEEGGPGFNGNDGG